MATGSAPVLDEQVATWIDDLAEPERAIDGIVALGHDAIGPLCAYLDRAPQLVSQPRELAVRMLVRLHDPGVAGRLRRLLRDNPLHGLPPALAESEYRVKDAAMAGLAEQSGTAAADDVAFGVHSERLPAALRAAGRLRLHALAPSLAALLADDVLTDVAAEALHALRPESTSDVLAAITAWSCADADTPRTRLALIRAFLWLQLAGEPLPPETRRQALRHPCPPVRAAAALDVEGATPAEADAVASALAHGALGTDERLAMACRMRLRGVSGLPFEPLVRAAMRANDCTRAILVGHNASFDLGFLNAAIRRTGHKRSPFHPFSSFDTVTLAGLAYGQTVLSRAVEASGHAWDAREAHSAVYDAERTAELFCTIVNRWREMDLRSRVI